MRHLYCLLAPELHLLLALEGGYRSVHLPWDRFRTYRPDVVGGGGVGGGKGKDDEREREREREREKERERE